MPTTPRPDAVAAWQNLADALNALIDAGHAPAFHNLIGSANDWRHQPCVSTPLYSDAPRVVLDLNTNQYTVSTRERTNNGEHSPRRRRRRRR